MLLHPVKSLAAVAALVVALALPAVASAGELVYQFRSQEDPALPSRPASCPYFAPTLQTGAHLYSYRTSASDGLVVNDIVQEIGTARVCAVITDFAFTPASELEVYGEFQLGDGTYAAVGTCQVSTNDVPVSGVVLAGCTMRVLSGPAGTVGGLLANNGVLNPRRIPGFSTGSYWTVRAYTAD